MSTKHRTGLMALKDKKKHLELLQAFFSQSNASNFEKKLWPLEEIWVVKSEGEKQEIMVVYLSKIANIGVCLIIKIIFMQTKKKWKI